jgi:hypothetical protein
MTEVREVDRERPRVAGPVACAIAVQLAIAGATVAVKLDSGRDDADIYFRYATLILEGKVPYRDFRVEYPPLSLPLFLVPALVARDVVAFKLAFGCEMLLFNAATVWLVAAWQRRHGRADVRLALVRYTILYLFLARLIVLRYDAAAMFLGFAASTWWSSGRAGPGGIAAALGALMKVFPAAVAVVAAPWELLRNRSPGRGLLTFTGTMTLGVLAWSAIGTPRGVAESLGYQLERGFEYGSLYSGVQMLAARAVGDEIDVVRDHAAWSSVTPWTRGLLKAVFPIQAGMILAVAATFYRRGMTNIVRYAGAAILAFIITSKVFSPQYLIWLLPFMAVLEGPFARRAFWFFAAGCTATLVAPAITSWAPRTGMTVILAYNIKNVLFLVLLAILLRSPISGGPSRDHHLASG